MYTKTPADQFAGIFVLYKSSRNVLGPRGACSPVDKNISDDNRYEHEVTRKRHGSAHTC